MGNAISYIGAHGKRLLNRYNAQFRALRFIDRKKLPSAPRHATLLHHVDEDPMIYEHLLKKDPSLDKYLKDVYVKSYGEEQLASEQNNPKRPLPVYNESPVKNPFQEPVEKTKGLCTLSQFFEFRSAHENDPIENSAMEIARNYSLDVEKVENLLKYYSVFRVREQIMEGQRQSEEKEQTLMELIDGMKDMNKKNLEEKTKDKTETETLQLKSRDAKN